MCLCTLSHTVAFLIIFIHSFLNFHSFLKQCDIYCVAIHCPILCQLMCVMMKRQFLLSETCLLKKVRIEQRSTLQYDKSYDRRIQVSYRNV